MSKADDYIQQAEAYRRRVRELAEPPQPTLVVSSATRICVNQFTGNLEISGAPINVPDIPKLISFLRDTYGL